MEIKGNDAAYLMGNAEPVRSSVLTSSSRFLNNPRMRDIYAQMGLKRNGDDLPDAYLVPEVNRAIAEESDFARLHALIAAERDRLPDFATWLDARFVSDWSAEKVAHCAEGTVGWLIHRFITESGMEIDFMFRGEPADDFEYMTKRRVQNHDIEHLVTGLDPSPVGEIGLIVANCSAIHGYFSPDLAGELTFQTMFLASTSLMRTACHYPAVVPAMLEAFARGDALGRKQAKPLFMIKWEDWIDVSAKEAREALGFEDGPPERHWAWTVEAAKG
jgi:ubiquinone biosynthesis protein Coq4